MLRRRLRIEGSLAKTGLMIGLCVGFLLFHIWFRTRTLALGYEVGRERAEISKLESDIAGLKVDRNRLMGPSRLEALVGELAQRGRVLRPAEESQLIYPRARR
jgi:hypothetical protein